ncbi:aminopeptidase N [Microbacterium sp. JZ31]|uniref:aminopeptidase N n=1 Tax=Microbacterium sp. JZ31 TaxID=1906274 RepID=UPI001934AA73|nr:aminopeptidase N [Microbacterium sp. JZ31]
MTSANLTRDETAARAAAISLRHARVELDVSGAPDPQRTGFPTTVTLGFDAHADATWIDFLGEAVLRVQVNGSEQDVDWDGARIRIAGLARGANEVRIEAVGAYSRSGEGLHRFRDPVDGETYLYTQYEPADARRVMPCFEQPDLKARYTFVITAPAGWHVLSNQAPARSSDDGATQTVEFAPTLPISSYITAVVAGPYHRVTGEWSKPSADGAEQRVPLGAYCRASLAPHFDADEILEITRQGLDFFDEAFGFPYPWSTYDQVFVPEYNLGAMENPGLVTFTEAYVFRGASTDAQHEGRANTILHEMAHMWFGDLVTMRWWDDLWLKESFADYMGSHASVAATRFTDAWVSFAARRKTWAYLQDQLPTTHPIVADIPDLEAAKLNFDGITYAKGASVLKQLVAYVGEEAFFEGARRYFRAHAYGNTTLGDLLTELEGASGRDLRAWSAAWLETTGMSTIAYDRSARALTQTDVRPHRLAIGCYTLANGRLTRTDLIETDLLEESAPLPLPDADLILINDRDLTYAKARLDERSLAAVEEGLSTIEDPLARGLIWASLWDATRDGELPARRYLAIVRRHAPAEPNVGLLTAATANAAFAIGHYVPTPDRPAERRAWLDTTWEQTRTSTGGTQLTWARALGGAAAFDDGRATGLRAMLDGSAPAPEGLALDADLRWSWLTALAATGHAGQAEADAELARDDTATGRTSWIRVLAARPEAEVRAAAWDAAWHDLALTNDHLDATIGGFRTGDSRHLIARFDDEYFARIRDAWSERSIEIARRLVTGLFPSSESLDPVDAWLAANADAPASLRRLVLEQRDHLARELRVRAAQG